MKKFFMAVPLVLATASPLLAASDVGFDVNINVGNRPGVVIPAPPAVVVPTPRVVIEEPPVFIEPPRLGFYVGVDVPYDLFYISGRYYLWQDNHWYRAPHYRGPWNVVSYSNLPPGLRKHKLERIRYYRDDEYRVYHREHDRYRGKHFKPEKEYKKRYKEERKREKFENKHRGEGRGHGHGD
ncbi:YXWGXW repeat-containing protein [Geobacter hydrogenophilus]|uniref:Uncharacterized protein n=1 Tax=Geobacter hydrogenophilus TaxID=40983 RepID=A0A9W6G241_9BACT|nr:YXWGXW repeat-containing protein [Geobacter hydrogenophilus]MBT0893089.1 YXWGXW repeat-containing protein [Geobacter hydrogenophilus]GLI39071.1 hypothetical protein GHYDROH2_25720 [Geobacter hydrogenophilus]